jgi:hypothetical protein
MNSWTSAWALLVRLQARKLVVVAVRVPLLHLYVPCDGGKVVVGMSGGLSSFVHVLALPCQFLSL